jgi:hypothetical protein
MIRVVSAAVCTVTESIALARIKAMAFIRNLIGVVEEICDHPHEFAAMVNWSTDWRRWARHFTAGSLRYLRKLDSAHNLCPNAHAMRGNIVQSKGREIYVQRNRL